MDFLVPMEYQLSGTVRALEGCNRLTEGYGLTLTVGQMRALAQRRVEALQATDRVEFGEGILKKLILTFRDSPYLCQQNYEEIIAELQDLFYHFKNEVGEGLTDDELIGRMKGLFDGKAQGALELMDKLLEEPDDPEEDEDEG